MPEIYYGAVFHGPIRPYHAPTMAGGIEGSRGYDVTWKEFAIGYMKGIMDTRNIVYE